MAANAAPYDAGSGTTLLSRRAPGASSAIGATIAGRSCCLQSAVTCSDGESACGRINEGARLETRVLRETALDAAERSGNTLAARILAARGARVPEKPSSW
jgi:hypothetical protein